MKKIRVKTFVKKFTNIIKKTNQKCYRYINKKDDQRFERQNIQTSYLYGIL